MKTGTQLIADERQRQIEKEGYDKEHDNEHVLGELSVAAACYAINKINIPNVEISIRFDKITDSPFFGLGQETGEAFPFDSKYDKREKHSRLKSLIIAGAMIAAEIDRELAETPQEELSQDKSLFCQRNKTN